MNKDPRKPIRIELTDEQQKQIKDEAGVQPASIEFTIDELEERVAPRRLNF